MCLFEWSENLSIFLDNLCIYHVCLDLLSLFMIVFTWWYCNLKNPTMQQRTVTSNQGETLNDDSVTRSGTEALLNKKAQEKSDILDWSNDAIKSNVKFMRHKVLVKEMKSKLSEDELKQEKKTEKMQLEKIFQLLQEQEDKFKMSSMEQLEDQLHLYIN